MYCPVRQPPTWCWRKGLRTPWTTREKIKCVLEQIKPNPLPEAKMTNLKLSYFRLGEKAGFFGKSNNARNIEGSGKEEDAICNVQTLSRKP